MLYMKIVEIRLPGCRDFIRFLHHFFALWSILISAKISALISRMIS